MKIGRGALLAAVVALLCACDEREPLDPNLAKIRPRAAPSANAAEAARYVVAPSSKIAFELARRSHGVTGHFDRIAGEVDVDLLELSKTRGTIRVDLTSIHVDANPDEPLARASEALSWMGLGSERPAADRSFRRFATFEIFGLRDLSADAAFAGKRVRRTDQDEESEGAETRRVDLEARGSLTLNAHRAPSSFPLRAEFHFPEPALTGVAPDAIVLGARGRPSLDLPTFDIAPRDDKGTVLPARKRQARSALGGRVRLTLELTLTPAGALGQRGFQTKPTR